MRAGAKGYVTKGSDRELIVSTVEAVAAGAFLLSADLADVIKVELAGRSASAPPAETAWLTPLSPREERR